MTTNEKLQALRECMKRENIDAYYVPTADPHMSEYVTPHFQTRAWISGFTGSAGQALVFQDDAKLWADGRYFIQAEQEIADSAFELMKMATPGYPSLHTYLLENIPEGGRVAADGRCISRSEQETLEAKLAQKNVELVLDLDLLGEIWENRPELPKGQAFLLDIEYTGKATEDKLRELREVMKEKEEDFQLIGKLDDIAWLFNIRGADVKHTPVILSYALISQDAALFFLDEEKLTKEISESLQASGITTKPYDAVYEVLETLEQKTITIRIDTRYINASVYKAIPQSNEIVEASDWTAYEKAIKNETEIRQQKEAYIKDGLAVTRMIHWLKTNDVTKLDEVTVSDTLLSYREELDHFIEESFTTIAAYGPNAAMMHYAPTEEKQSKLEAKSFLLVDSGGQYLEGTTDTTRTIALGSLTDEEIKDYTLTLKGHINLARAVFLEGTTGNTLDILARYPLWQHRMDYKSGTGHGVGYLLSVHEGPHSISKARLNQNLVPGMVVTNEPGVYKEGKHGIRLENVYYVVEDELVDRDQYYRFENFTMVPFEREAIDLNLLTAEEREWIDQYHAKVFETLESRLDKECAKWLKSICAPL